MNNREVAAQFNLLAALMELHGENAFKTKTYLSAYQSLRKWDRPLEDMDASEFASIPGVGASAASKIAELMSKGKMESLEKLKEKTPPGIQQLLQIKGMGPKKIRVIWDSLGVETPAELLYACQENRLVKLPGFGLKTQEDLKDKISYYLDSQHRYLFGVIDRDLRDFENKWQKSFPKFSLQWMGEVACKSPVISSIEALLTPLFPAENISSLDGAELISQDGEDLFSVKFADRYTIRIQTVAESNMLHTWAKQTFSKTLYDKLSTALQSYKGETISEFLSQHGYGGLPAEMMDAGDIDKMSPEYWADLVEEKDLKGILHNHSTWSDGINTLEEMSVYVRDSGYQYFGISDHSQSAFYANGLQSERVLQQMEEIDAINAKLAPFKVFKGIESDILNDGSLDYEEDVLRKFDYVVASIHTNLRMDEDKATDRLIRAIENPYTRILGHPTSRLLLARPGYPVNFKKLIDACAANGVVIEVNSNPQRMDIDYSWIPYCQEKGVMLSINPDAHSRSQIGYVTYGTLTSRKGGLKRHNCLNALDLAEFQKWIDAKR